MSKIDCSRDASLMIQNAIGAHVSQWEKINNTVEYLMEYKRPVDEHLLLEEKMGWRNNWNYGRGRMFVEQGVTSNVMDMVKTLAMMEVSFNQFDEEKHKNKIYQFIQNERFRFIFGNAISEIFADILEEDVRFHDFLTRIEYSSYLFGYSPVIRDKFTYLGKPVFLTDIAFEDRTEIYQILNWVVFDNIKGEQLLQKVDKINKLKLKANPYTPDDDEVFHVYENGWVKEGIEELFCRILERNDEIKEHVTNGELTIGEIGEDKQLKITQWEDVETIRQFKGSMWMSINVNNIPIAKIFSTDEKGNITETHIVCNKSIVSVEDQKCPEFSAECNKYILFIKNQKKIPYTDLINLIKEFAISSTGYIQDIRGVSKQIVEEAVRYDTKRNNIEDKLIVQGSLILSKSEELDNPAVKVLGAYTFLPPGVNMAPGQIKVDLNDHIQSINQDDQDFKERVFHYNPQLQLSNRPTKDEVQLRGNQHSFQRNAKIPSKLRDYAVLFKNILNDLFFEDFENPIDSRMKEEFENRLINALSEFSITKKDLDKIIKEISCITLHPVNGDLQSIQTAMPFAQNSDGRMRLIRSYLLALGFSRRDVNMFVEVADFGYQIQQAALENAAFYNTSEVVFDQSQDHIGHVTTHFAKFDRIIRGVQAGEDIVRGFNYLTNGLTNTEKHVNAIASSFFFKNRAKEFVNIQKAFVKTAKQISDIINKKKQENQQNQSSDMTIPPEELRKIQLLEWQMQKKNERTNWLTAQSAQRKAIEFEQKLQMKKAESDLVLTQKKEFSDLQKELEQIKAAIKLSQ